MSESNYIPTSLYLAAEQPKFDAMADASAVIRTHNEQGPGFDENANDDRFHSIGDEYLVEVQTKALGQLILAAEQIDYDELMQRVEINDNWLDRLANERLAVKDEIAAEAIELHKKADEHAAWLPGAADRFHANAEERVTLLSRERLGKLDSEERAAQSIATKLGETLRTVGQMPIPNYVSPEQRMEIYETYKQPTPVETVVTQEPEVVEEDHFPVDPTTLTKAELVERVQKSFPAERLADASTYLALIIAEDPGRAFTYNELGKIIYPNEELRVSSTRVAALISNIRVANIKVIPNTLAEQHNPPLVLQIGERIRVKKANGQRVGQARRVLRAVVSTNEPTRSLTEDDQADINWTNVEERGTSTEVD